MTIEEELEELREFKKAHEGKSLNRAFARLELILANPGFDPIISRRAFLCIADCLVALKDEVIKL